MTTTFKINSLRKLAEKYAREIEKAEEIEKIDRTQLLEAEVRYQIRNGEIVIMEVHAKPRLGKSTVGTFIAREWIDDELKKCGKKDKKKKFGMQNMARDDQEYSKMMRNPNLMNDVIVIDENNELERGGENATTERQLKDVFSDVQAGRYVHKVCISPETDIDKNSDILLEVVGIDSKEMITHCRVYYRINNAQNKYWQMIGHANICVKSLILNWERNIKEIFLKTEKTKEEIEFLKKEIKKDFFAEYMMKKYEKMDLITKEGILRPRELDYSEAVINVIKNLKNLTRVMNVDDKLIRSYTESEFRKLKLVGSIVGIKLSADRASGVLNLYRNVHRTIQKRNTEVNEAKENNKDRMEIDEMRDGYDKIIADLMAIINSQEDELKRNMEIKKKYNEHFI